MIKLLVVDKHPIVRKGLELIFDVSQEIKFMGSVGDGESIFDFIQKTPVDVIIAEIDLPKLNGITALRRLKKEFPKTKVIIYSEQPESVYAVSALKAGARGFVPKTADILTLKEAIVRVIHGDVLFEQRVNQTVGLGNKIQQNKSLLQKTIHKRSRGIETIVFRKTQ